MILHDCNDNSYRAFSNLEEAIEFYEWFFKHKAFTKDGDCNCSLGIGVDRAGNNWFVLAQPHYFKDCYKEDLYNWKNWYEDEWIEREDE